MSSGFFFFFLLMKKTTRRVAVRAVMPKPIQKRTSEDKVVSAFTVISAITDDESPSLSVTVRVTVYVPFSLYA